MITISTPRLVIRPFSADDTDDVITCILMLDARTYPPYQTMSKERVPSYLIEQAALRDEETNCYHAFAVHHIADNKVIGDVGIWRPAFPEDTAELGFQFRPDYHGQGYATEAARAFLQYLFEHWNIRCVTSTCDVRNLPSLRVMERLGMRREAHFVQSRITKGVAHDEYACAVLRDEWFAKQGTRGDVNKLMK